MNFSQFNDNLTQFYIENNGVDEIVPLKHELSIVLKEYKEKTNKNRNEPFYTVEEDTISSSVRRFSEKACGKGYTPTEFSNTFIRKSLGEDKDKNIYAVSKLTLETLNTIEKHIEGSPNWLIDRQNEILKKW